MVVTNVGSEGNRGEGWFHAAAVFATGRIVTVSRDTVRTAGERGCMILSRIPPRSAGQRGGAHALAFSALYPAMIAQV